MHLVNMKGQNFIQFVVLDPWFVLHISWSC